MPRNQMKELVIDDKNFAQYFFDAKKHKPRPGQVMAKFSATAELVDGQLKRDLIKLLFQPNQAESAIRVMRVIGQATARDSIRVIREMAHDLYAQNDIEKVAAKPYKFIMEQIYWAEKDVVPTNNPHWETISLINTTYTDKNGSPIDLDLSAKSVVE